LFEGCSGWSPVLRGLGRAVVLALALAAGAGWAETVAPAAGPEVPAPGHPSLVWPAHNNIPAEAWLDRTGTAGFDAAHAAFESGLGQSAQSDQKEPLTRGDALWLQLHLPEVGAPTDAVLAVPYAGIDRVELFRRDAQGVWQHSISGDSVPVSRWPVRYLYPVFDVELHPGAGELVYMRVQHDYPIAVKWVLWDVASFNESSKLWHLALGACGGLMLLVIVLCLAHAVSWRDPIHFTYAVHVMLVAFSLAALTGIAGEYLWPDNAWWNDAACLAFPIAALGWMGMFARELVAERGKRKVSWLLLGHAIVSFVLVILFLALGREAMFATTNGYGLVGLLLLFGVLVWYSIRRPQVGLWVVAGMGTLIASAVFPVLRNLGLVPVTFVTQYGPQVGGVFEVPLVLVGLYFRSRERRDNRMRMDHLSHTDPLTGVANHRVLVECIDRLLRRARKDATLGGVLRIHVLNLASIRGEYGREAAEAAIVRAAECVTLEAAENDLVAREQGGDLVLVLDGKVTRAQATEAARDIIARGLKFSGRLPPGVTLSLRVTGVCAPLPPDEDATSLLGLLARMIADIAAGGRAISILHRPEDPPSGPGAP
jgi:two-component system, sensor histidine kinase LadS